MKRPSEILVTLLFLLVTAHVAAQDPFEEPPIAYRETRPDNPVERLRADLAEGRVELERDDQFGYLKPLLEQLRVPVESQVLVFSKTSLQAQYITPTNPRSIYFNDDVYIGGVPGADLLEISVADPNLGAVFYVLSQYGENPPEIQRKNSACLQCHASSLTRGVPGHLVRSVFPDGEGFPILRAGTAVTTHESPFDERWGGWYVTGTHGDIRHRANEFATENEYGAEVDREAGANRERLPERVDPARYLTDSSDIVALMLLEHQTEMHNHLTRASFDTRYALRDQEVMDEIMQRESEGLRASTRSRIWNAGVKVADYMLFLEEPRLESPIAGSSSFAGKFAALGPKDALGRSLRDLDLETRLLQYPLSYLIYSEQFQGLPFQVKSAIYRRIWDVLTGTAELDSNQTPPTPEQAKAIREILVDTVPDIPEYWQREK